MIQAALSLLLALTGDGFAQTPGDILGRAAGDVRTGLLNEYILMTSVQASLIELEWALKGGKTEAGVTRVKADNERLSAKLKRFRDAAEAVDAQTNPLEPVLADLKNSKKVRAAASNLPPTLAGQVAEIQGIRAAYDADLSRSALIRARTAAKELETRLGPARLLDSQKAVMAQAADFLADLRRTQKELKEALPSPSKDAARCLNALKADAVDMATEVDRLRLHFILDNYVPARPAGKENP